MNGTENLVFTSIDVDTLIERIAERVIIIMTFNGNPEKIRKFFIRKELLKTPIDQLNTSYRLYNSLKTYSDIRTLEDLVMSTEKDLMRIRNFGNKSMAEVKNLLEGYGLSLEE